MVAWTLRATEVRVKPRKRRVSREPGLKDVRQVLQQRFPILRMVSMYFNPVYHLGEEYRSERKIKETLLRWETNKKTRRQLYQTQLEHFQHGVWQVRAVSCTCIPEAARTIVGFAQAQLLWIRAPWKSILGKLEKSMQKNNQSSMITSHSISYPQVRISWKAFPREIRIPSPIKQVS